MLWRLNDSFVCTFSLWTRIKSYSFNNFCEIGELRYGRFKSHPSVSVLFKSPFEVCQSENLIWKWLGRAALTRRKLSWSGNIQTAWDANVGRVRLRLRAHSHNNPAGGHRGPGQGRLGPWGACLTWRLKTRGGWWHVSCPLCHTGWMQGSQESRITHRTGWPPATNWRCEAEMLRIAGARRGLDRVSAARRRTVSSLWLRPRSCPRLSPRHLNYRQSRSWTRVHTGSVSVLVTCSSYSQSYGGYLKISIWVQFRNIVALFSNNHVCKWSLKVRILIDISFNHISRSLLADISSQKSVQLTNTKSFWRLLILKVKATKHTFWYREKDLI